MAYSGGREIIYKSGINSVPSNSSDGGVVRDHIGKQRDETEASLHIGGSSRTAFRGILLLCRRLVSKQARQS